jgi:hypothetical protein
MIFGISTAAYTAVHVVLSLAGIGSGFVVLFGLLTGKRLGGWTALFLITTAATSLTGFGFPFRKLAPAHIIGVISLVVLIMAMLARYSLHLAGAWRPAYVIAVLVALYLNVLVAIVQAFEKIPALKALAPTRFNPAFLVVQLLVLAVFIVVGVLATKRFREAAHATAKTA